MPSIVPVVGPIDRCGRPPRQSERHSNQHLSFRTGSKGRAMGIRKTEMKRRLMEQRDRLLGEIEALRNKVAGLEMAFAMIDGDDTAVEQEPARRGRGSAKATLLGLLHEMGTTGL